MYRLGSERITSFETNVWPKGRGDGNRNSLDPQSLRRPVLYWGGEILMDDYDTKARNVIRRSMPPDKLDSGTVAVLSDEIAAALREARSRQEPLVEVYERMIFQVSKAARDKAMDKAKRISGAMEVLEELFPDELASVALSPSPPIEGN
jgi:hypothetical protein